MDYSLTFARHFSRLVWLLLHEGGNVEEQKAALRALVTVAKDGPVTLTTEEFQLVVNKQPLPEVLTGVQDLTAQMIGHAVAEIAVQQSAAPADLLGVARILAAEPVPGDGGRAIEQRLAALAARTVRVTTKGPAAAGSAPAAAPGAPGGPGGPGGPAAVPRASGPVRRRSRPVSIARDSGARRAVIGLYTDESSGSYLPFAAVRPPTGTVLDLLEQIDKTTALNPTMKLLDGLVTLAEDAAREGRIGTVGDAYCGIATREAKLPEGELKRAYTMAMRRLAKPSILRITAQLLPMRKERVDELLLILGHAGEDGAEAAIEQLVAAQSLSDRRVFFDALVKLQAGVPALIHMLRDSRWYVARNAADLLGEMQATQAERPLTELLKHDDDRVRRAATTALAKLGTPRALDALRRALKDTSAQVRMQAAAGLALKKDQRNVTTVAKALDEETDAEVQLAILAALGRLATGDAVKRLVDAAAPGGLLFGKKSVAYRVAAVQALGEAKTPAARQALDALVHDKEKDVRDAVFRILMQLKAEAQSESRDESG